MRKRQGYLALLVCLVMATSASAAFVQVNDMQDTPFQYTGVSNNLIQSGSATLASQFNSAAGLFVAEGTGFGGLPQMNDGIITPATGQPNTQIALMDGFDDLGTKGPNPYQVFELDLTGAPLGYDLKEVAGFASWSGSIGVPDYTTSNARNWQKWTVKYNLVGEVYSGSGELNHTLGTIAEYTPNGSGSGVYSATKVSLTDDSGTLVSGVSALEIFYDGQGQSGGGYVLGTNSTAYSEIQMGGTPTVPEPSTLALLACGLFGLLAYAWKRRR